MSALSAIIEGNVDYFPTNQRDTYNKIITYNVGNYKSVHNFDR